MVVWSGGCAVEQLDYYLFFNPVQFDLNFPKNGTKNETKIVKKKNTTKIT